MPAVAPADQHNPSGTGVPTPSAATTGGVARKTARSTPTRRQQVEQAARLAMPAVAPADQHNPSGTGVPTSSAARTGGVARKTARSTPTRRQQVEQATRLAMPAVAPAERHNPERYGGSNAVRRHDWRRGTQDCALHPNGKWSKPPGLPCRRSRRQSNTTRAARGFQRHPPSASGACRQACHAGGPAGRATQPERYAGCNAVRRHDCWRGTQDCALHPNTPSASGASRQACHAGGRAGRAT